MTKWMHMGMLVLALQMGTAMADTPKSGWVARVNGVEITSDDAKAFNMLSVEQTGFEYKPHTVADELIMRELLVQEGINRGMDTKLSKKELATKVYNDFMAMNTLDESDITKMYEAQKKQILENAEQEYKFRHIVLKTSEQAQEIIDGLNKGEAFVSFVSKSLDTNSAKDEGKVDWMPRAAMEPEYAAAMVLLQPDNYSKAPVKSSSGYAVVWLDDVRAPSVQSFAEMRETLVKEAMAERLEKLIQPLRDKSTIERSDEYLVPRSAWH